MDQKNNRTVIHAMVPLAEILRYGTDLRSMTQGRVLYTIEFDHFEQFLIWPRMPFPSISTKIMKSDLVE